MKNLLLFLLLVSFNFTYGQSYLGFVNKQVNFRQGPGTDYKVIKSLVAGNQLFITSLNTKNNYYNVIDISSNTEGYVYKSYVNLGDEVERNEGGIFVPTGKSDNSLSKIEVFNKTELSLTLKMGDNIYIFSPNEKTEINVKAGDYKYRASAVGVIPYIGKEIIETGMNYSWQFYIVTK